MFIVTALIPTGVIITAKHHYGAYGDGKFGVRRGCHLSEFTEGQKHYRMLFGRIGIPENRLNLTSDLQILYFVLYCRKQESIANG